ncbi:helix-turn-helix domain-containing protein [Nocardioides sp. B-3]|uniref:helix-turn-helix domain-containing protein n=1 Tax=Nocardioides sp. B-3 TaxID=2895565 RepID=UPI003FA5FF8C
MGVSQSAVAKWETGRTSPSARMLARVPDSGELELGSREAGRGAGRGAGCADEGGHGEGRSESSLSGAHLCVGRRVVGARGSRHDPPVPGRSCAGPRTRACPGCATAGVGGRRARPRPRILQTTRRGASWWRRRGKGGSRDDTRR